MASKDALLNNLKKIEADSHEDRQEKKDKTIGSKSTTKRSAISLSMSPSEKDRYTQMSRDHGLSLSAFFRLAADEYAENHDW